MQDRIKRLIDILLAGGALLALAPILAAVWAAIRIEDGGPSTYTSKRVGSGYRVFSLYKFRSMYRDADQRLGELASLNQYAADQDLATDSECTACAALGSACSPLLFSDEGPVCEARWTRIQQADNASAFIKLQRDPRITKVGRFIRKTSLDELPQLVNVLKGDMSLVGNRPLPLYEAEVLTRDDAVARFMAPAGLTGLWQVTKRGGSDMSAEERIALDNQYAKTRSLKGDLTIMLQTVPALLQTEDV